MLPVRVRDAPRAARRGDPDPGPSQPREPEGPGPGRERSPGPGPGPGQGKTDTKLKFRELFNFISFEFSVIAVTFGFFSETY